MLACVRLRPRPFRLLSRTPDSASSPPRPLSASLLSVPACRPSLFRFAAPAVRHLRAFRPRCTAPPWGSWVCLRSGLQDPLNPSDRNPHELLRGGGVTRLPLPSVFPGWLGTGWACPGAANPKNASCSKLPHRHDCISWVAQLFQRKKRLYFKLFRRNECVFA